MRALVIGASGQVGAALLHVLRARGHEAVGTWAHDEAPGLVRLDVTDGAATERLVAATRPDWVLCPAALSHVDYCEEHPAEAFAANLDGPLGAAQAAARVGAGFVYYSSDYVFDGVDGPYAEDARPRPLGVYGQSKWEGEQAVLGALARVLVVRTSVVYGPERQEKNSVYQLLRACRGGKGFRPAVDQRASPSYNADVAAATVECCERELSGTWHLAGADVLDRMAYALLVCRVFDLDTACLTPATTAELGQKAARPLNGGLRIGKAQAQLRTPLRGAEAGLRAMRAALAAGAPGG
ncbi:MAG TPA: SDR family oxidoreductase [Methylomirabilota bacterium]|nr:SDR family oxidoreductase [Methylomirabilota bacterium]